MWINTVRHHYVYKYAMQCNGMQCIQRNLKVFDSGMQQMHMDACIKHIVLFYEHYRIQPWNCLFVEMLEIQLEKL